ncbi:hypothetical protein EYF80_031022 [Liparis tanakae]|uniref:Uncharacterized protein n=1 Tax=Liparis tanakae TaxID=230148 RepID=A0A4Z2GYQ4_9TELE|nr:hypothetical protein EYF80_031022 [Liparis tanakae]
MGLLTFEGSPDGQVSQGTRRALFSSCHLWCRKPRHSPPSGKLCPGFAEHDPASHGDDGTSAVWRVKCPLSLTGPVTDPSARRGAECHEDNSAPVSCRPSSAG